MTQYTRYQTPKHHNHRRTVISFSCGERASPIKQPSFTTPITNHAANHPQNDAFPANPFGAHGGRQNAEQKKHPQGKNKKNAPRPNDMEQNNPSITFFSRFNVHRPLTQHSSSTSPPRYDNGQSQSPATTKPKTVRLPSAHYSPRTTSDTHYTNPAP